MSDYSKRKGHYKHTPCSVEQQKQKRGQEILSLRKDTREKILSSKRFRPDATIDQDAEHSFTVDIVKDVSKKLQTASATEALGLLQTLRQACAHGTLYIDAFLSVENSLQCVVGLLSGNNVELQQDAAWCLSNVSAGTHEHANAVARSAAPYLITLLSCSNSTLQDQCAWVLGNIAGDCPQCRDLLHAQGIVRPLVRLLQCPVQAVVQSSAFALSNIARESHDITKELVSAGIIEMLAPYLLVEADKRSTLTEVAWILTYLSSTGEHVSAMIEQGFLSTVCELLVKLHTEEPQDVQTVTPLLRCLGNICSGPDEHTMLAMENPRLLNTLANYLDSSIRHIVKETLWVFSNIVGEASVATSIAYGPTVEKISEKLEAGFDIKHEALYAVNNIASHGGEACECLLRNGVLQRVVANLKSHDLDILQLSLATCHLLITLTLEGSSLFEQCEGVSRLEGLEYHNNTVISSKANDLLETYFSLDTEQEANG